jgi:hypothetical protein
MPLRSSPDVTVPASSPGLANTLVDVGAACLKGGGPSAAVVARLEACEWRLPRFAAAVAAPLIAAAVAATASPGAVIIIPSVLAVVWALSV